MKQTVGSTTRHTSRGIAKWNPATSRLTLLIVGFTALGSILISASHATKVAIDAEVESDGIAGNACLTHDASASDHKARQFGMTACSGINPLRGLAQLPWFGGPSWYGSFPKSGGWNDHTFFPIGAWWNDYSNDAEVKWDKSVGLNFYVQLNGDEDASLFGANDMFWIGNNDFGNLSDNDPAWVGNFLDDEVDGRYPDVNDGYAAVQALVDQASPDRFDMINYTAIVSSDYNEAQHISSSHFVNMVAGPVSIDAYFYTGEWCRQTGDDYQNHQFGALDQPHCATSASYGQTIRALRERDMSDGVAQPVFTFVESGAPYENGRQIAPDQEKGAIWNSLIAGANGIIWFPQSFSGDCMSGSTVRIAQYSLQEGCADANIAALQTVNLEVQSFAPVLNTPSYEHSFGTNLDTMLKWYGNSAYIFSMIGGGSTSWADKNADTSKNAQGARTFTLPKGLNRATSVTVLNENRTISVRGGQFTDHFAHEYTYHIYKVAP